ncbi:MAG: DUF6160 family protein [Desulfatibacillaceae bacterium]
MRVVVAIAACIAVAALWAAPGLAEMESVTDREMEKVRGQAGIAIDASIQVTSGYVAFGDEDGVGTSGTYSGGGFFTAGGMTYDDGGGPVNINGLSIDMGTNADGGTAVVITGTGGRRTLSFEGLKLGSALDSGTSFGSLTFGDIGTAGGATVITPH